MQATYIERAFLPMPPLQNLGSIWALATVWSPEETARRVLQRTTLHHSVLLVVLVALLFMRATFTFWSTLVKCVRLGAAGACWAASACCTVPRSHMTYFDVPL